MPFGIIISKFEENEIVDKKSEDEHKNIPKIIRNLWGKLSYLKYLKLK